MIKLSFPAMRTQTKETKESVYLPPYSQPCDCHATVLQVGAVREQLPKPCRRPWQFGAGSVVCMHRKHAASENMPLPETHLDSPRGGTANILCACSTRHPLWCHDFLR